MNTLLIIYIDSYFNNIDTRTLGDLSDLLEPQDGYRFYRVNTLDCSTTVAVYQVRLEPSGEICRSRSETNKQTHEHAELAAIKKKKEWLDETMKDLTGQTEISLTTMATSNPCLECQSAILKMLVDCRERLTLTTVNYKLRIGYLYHGKPPQRLNDREVREQLADWKWNMKDSGVNFTLEPIAVCDELPVPSLETRKKVTRENVISKRKVYDSNIADHVQKINAAPRQQKIEQYTEPIKSQFSTETT